MFGASAGLMDKSLIHNHHGGSYRQDIHKQTHQEKPAPSATKASTPPAIKNPLLRLLHGRWRCFFVEWCVNKFTNRSKFWKMYDAVCIYNSQTNVKGVSPRLITNMYHVMIYKASFFNYRVRSN